MTTISETTLIKLKNHTVETTITNTHNIKVSMSEILKALGVYEYGGLKVEIDNPSTPGSYASSFQASRSSEVTITWNECLNKVDSIV